MRESMKERVAAARWRGSSGSCFGRGVIRHRRRGERSSKSRTNCQLERGRQTRWCRHVRGSSTLRVDGSDVAEHVGRGSCGSASGFGRDVIRHRRRGERSIGSWNSRTIIAGTGLRLCSLAGMPSRPGPPPSISSPRGWSASGIWRSHGRGVIRNRRRGERDWWKAWRRESWRPGGRRNEWQSCAARDRRRRR